MKLYVLGLVVVTHSYRTEPFYILQLCPLIKVVVLHKDGAAASVDGREVVDQCSLLLSRAGEPVLILHG